MCALSACFFHLSSYKIPCWHFLQGASYWLHIPKQEDNQYGNADEAGDAIKIADADHQQIGSIVRQSARHVACHCQFHEEQLSGSKSFLLWFGGMAGGAASIDLRSNIDLPERKGEAECEL